MFEKLASIERTYEELTQQMTDPEIIGEMSRYTKIAKQQRELEPVVEQYRAARWGDDGRRVHPRGGGWRAPGGARRRCRRSPAAAWS